LKGLSKDIELAIDSIIEGLEYDINISELDQTKLKNLMKSKQNSFKNAKDMINKWDNSQNSPNPDKLKAYIERLVDAGDSALRSLRSLLREKVNYEEIEEDKHHTISDGKVVLHEAIVSINTNITELKLQLEADKFNLSDKEFKRGYPERFANQEFFPLKNYYKEWYDPDEKSILLCPHGTKGKIIVLDNLKITLPKPPEDETKILFHDLPKEEQYWRRTELPKGLHSKNADDYNDFIINEYRKLREGVWFFNNGDKVWLPPSFYFALNWCKMKDNDGYMDFRYSQLDIAYHQLACELDTRCLGQLFVKSRRTGFTFVTLFKFLNKAITSNNFDVGMTSKTDSDAEEAFAKISYAYKNLPFFFQPVLKNDADSKKYLHFGKPTDRSKKAKLEKDTSTEGYLNTLVDYRATSETAYDSKKLNWYLGDEFSKWTNGRSFMKHWGQISPTMDEGGKIVGKAFIGSTIAAREKGGQDAFTLYKGSNINKRSAITGRTPSGLYSFFLPAHKNMREFTDKYGVCHTALEKGESFVNVDGEVKRVGSISYLDAMRKAKRKESDIAYNEEVRAFPMTADEAFRDEAMSCIFNMEKINEQIDYIGQMKQFDDVVKTGNFVWKDGIPDTTVEWKPSKNGHFKVTWLPPAELRNKYETRQGYGGFSKAPLNEHLGVFGCDSYDISGTVDGVTKLGRERKNAGSKGALHGVTRFSMGDIPSEHFFLEYIAREDTADKFFENVLMACIYYGMPILAENNKPRLLYHFKNRGYRNFAITRFDRPMNRLSKAEKEIGGMPNSSEDVKQMHASAIETYIEDHVGYNQEEGDYGRMYFEKTLRDWLSFDISKRTKFDATISSGLALMAKSRERYSPKRQKPKSITLNIKRAG
jgi:hypothetical protein